MATIYYKISPKEINSQSQILIRFLHGKFDKYAGTKISIPSKYWKIFDADSKGYGKSFKIELPRGSFATPESEAIKDYLNNARQSLTELAVYLCDEFQAVGAGKNLVSKEWLQETIDKWHLANNKEAKKQHFVNDDLGENVQKAKRLQNEFFEALDFFIENHEMSHGRKQHYTGLKGMLKRFEAYKKIHLTFDGLDISTLRDFEKYLANEYDLFKQGKLEKIMEETIDEEHPARITEARGKHTITGIMKRFRSFIRWANGISKQDKPDRIFTANNPFAQYPIGDSSNEQDYTTPYFITVNEIKKLQATKLPEALAVQRDIFVFHCLIGCRVSDLQGLTKNNIVDGFVQYIPRKTKEQRPVVVSVPLNDTALSILEKYKDLPGDKLLPFISYQKYNKAIKKIFTAAKLTRLVTVIDPKTGETIQRPLNELASSHMARRTFVGNLYNKVPDPNIIGSMTGHKEGSRAFLRYRSIGDKTKKKLVSYLD